MLTRYRHSGFTLNCDIDPTAAGTAVYVAIKVYRTAF